MATMKVKRKEKHTVACKGCTHKKPWFMTVVCKRPTGTTWDPVKGKIKVVNNVVCSVENKNGDCPFFSRGQK